MSVSQEDRAERDHAGTAAYALPRRTLCAAYAKHARAERDFQVLAARTSTRGVWLLLNEEQHVTEDWPLHCIAYPFNFGYLPSMKSSDMISDTSSVVGSKYKNRCMSLNEYMYGHRCSLSSRLDGVILVFVHIESCRAARVLKQPSSGQRLITK